MDPIVVVGASVGGATAANTLATAGVPVVMLERDLSRVKPCGGAVPPVAFSEFDIPYELISRKVHQTLIHSPSERSIAIEVVGSTPTENDYVAMVCRESFDPWLRNRAVRNGATLIEGAFLDLERDAAGVTVHYRDKASRQKQTIRASAVIGADGAYSPTAKALGLPRLPRCIAIQERMVLPPEKMARWEASADLYLGHDISPDLYGWVFPKSDHVAVGCGAGPGNTQAARQLLANLKTRLSDELAGGEVFMEEAHSLPMQPRPKMAFDRAMLIGDAAGLVVGTSGEGIYWAMKSGEMAAQTIVATLPDLSERALRRYEQRWWAQYGKMYRFLRGLQRWGYSNERQMEVFTDMCRNDDVQRLTFDSYMYKRMAPMPWLAQLRMTWDIAVSQLRHYLPRPEAQRPRPHVER